MGKVKGAGRIVVNKEKANLVPMLDPQARIDLPLFDQEPVMREFLAGTAGNTRAFIKVQDGCNNKCTFCVTTIARGEGQSRHLGEIIAEIQALTAAGYQEAVLSGVHMGSYGYDLGNRAGLMALVQAILDHTDIPPPAPVVVGTVGHCARLFYVVAKSAPAAPSTMPLQSGCDRTLRRMARRTNQAAFRELADAARAHIPDLNLSSDIIVGFPGETDDEFQTSLDYVREIGFSRLHVFTYSQRPGTAAAKMPGQIPGPVKKERVGRMIALGNEMSLAFHQQYEGQTMNVLWESSVGADNQGLRWVGYTDNYIRVHGHGPADLFNRVTRVRLENGRFDGIDGVISGRARQSGKTIAPQNPIISDCFARIVIGRRDGEKWRHA
ncbi:MAG: radical SAM protein [Chloroflexi bacterium]|nr:radical SAM protein [Chloroflexota bacterium]